MPESIIDSLFDDRAAFEEYFRHHDTQANRKALLKTSKLCYWYSFVIKIDPEVVARVDNQHQLALLAVRNWNTSHRDVIVRCFSKLRPRAADWEYWDKSGANQRDVLKMLMRMIG